MNKAKRALIVFTRSAHLESVCKKLFHDPRLDSRIYQSLIGHTLAVSSQSRADLPFDLFISSDQKPERSSVEIDGYILQSGSNFTARLKNTLTELFISGYTDVVVVGNDCPDLDTNTLIDAFTHLQKNDFVLGPAADGGTYLIGLKNTATLSIFNNIRWYAPTVFNELLTCIREHLQSVYILKMLNDIDSKSELVHWCYSSSSQLARIFRNLFLLYVIHEIPDRFIPFNRKRHQLRRIWQKAPPQTA